MHPFELKSGRSHPIDLWCTFYSDLENEALLREYRSLLSESERQQELRFHFARDRRRYLVTRALVRTVLSRYADIAPREWTFAVNDYGRPRIANTAAAAGEVAFNVSHTDGLIILAVARGHEIGVDVENTSVRAACIDIADRFFAPAEVSALHALPEARQQDRFFEYWTLKESYIKARSMGLSIPLDHFSFDLLEDDIAISIHQDQGDRPERWRFWQMSLGPGYLGALCAERVSREPPLLMVRNVVPLVSDQALPHTLLRSSKEHVAAATVG
ncbi:MAG TPA: 4'-phosphopantetheinyl transferase superfamily protein [Steroidobacteraceae bacterium]